MNDGFAALFDSLADDTLRRNLIEGTEELARGQSHVPAEVYLACFTSPAGKAVLRDLYNQFFNVQRFVPGEPPEAGYWREGAATLVQYIAAKMEAAAQGDLEDGDES